jgi:16S rRNA (cytosine967-C5)-methyltransferase
LVAAGGVLVYAVCALTQAEGADLVNQFLNQRAGWRAEDLHGEGRLPHAIGRAAWPGVVLTPAHDGTDGFYFARLRAP